MSPSSIGGINQLPLPEKRQVYSRLIPGEIISRFHLNPYLTDPSGNNLFEVSGPAGRASVELSLYHQAGFPDPVVYGHLTDTLNGKIHILLYVINNPLSERFDVDRLADGSPTKFGILSRNLGAEEAAMKAGLAPGQVRSGLRLLSNAIQTFEDFVASLGHDLYYIEPLFYHNAVLFEKHGFNYQTGRRKMQSIEEGFGLEGSLTAKLDGSSPFRMPGMEREIRSRSWAIHDGVLGEPFTDVTMYKVVGVESGTVTAPGIPY